MEIVAWFPTQPDAVRAVAALAMSYEVSEPTRADEPFNGRWWTVKIEVPVLGLGNAVTNSSLYNRALGLVWRHSGEIHDPEEI